MTLAEMVRFACPCVVVLCCLVPRARAQEAKPVPLPLADEFHPDAAFTDVYLNDSFEAADAIAKARSFVARGQWIEAAQVLQETSEEAGDKLVRVAPGFYVGIRKYVHTLIASWPEAGIAAYQSLYEPEARRALSDPRMSRSVGELLLLFDQYFPTATAAELADTIAQLAVEAGHLSVAEHVYQRVLKHHPDAETFAPHYRAMLAIVGAIRGNVEVDAPEGSESSTVRWKGQDRPVHEVLAMVREGFSLLHARRPTFEWPIFGGSVDRNRACSTGVGQLGLLWQSRGFESRSPDSTDASVGVSGAVDQDRSRFLSAFPVVSSGLVYAQRFREIVALHRNTGAVAWRFRAEETSSPGFSYIEEQPPGWDSVTTYDGYVYASLPGDTVPYYSYESVRSPPELVCLDADTGRPVWRMDERLIEEAFAEITFDSTPIVQHGRLYVVGRRRRSFGFEDCYLYCFDAGTGTLERRTHLGSASTGSFGSRKPTKSAAALHGETLYVCTNLGSIAAVSAHTGAVRWLRLYERVSADSARGSSTYTRGVKPWAFNPAIWSSGRITVLPLDAEEILLIEAENGKLLRSIPVAQLGEVESILGVRGDTLCGAGREVACYDLAAGETIWSAPLPEDTSLHGRGVWADERLLLPTRHGLSVFRVSDGERTDTVWDAEGEGGNLLALPDQILVAGSDRILAYVGRAELWKALQSRMASAPDDPLPALEFAEVALSSGEFVDAVTALDEAVRRTDRQTEPPDSSLARRLFDDVLMFVTRLTDRSKLDQALVTKLFDYASRHAPDAPANLRYRLRFAVLFAARQEPQRGIRLYQQILRDRSLRELPTDPTASNPESGGARATANIAAMIEQHGASIYAPFEAEAQGWLERARASDDEGTLERLVVTFPNSRTAPLALIAHGELDARRGRGKEAARKFAKALHRYPAQVDHPTLLRKIADAYETAGALEHAYRWLTKAGRDYPGVRFEHEGYLVSFLEYRDRLADVRDRVEPSRPDVVLPVAERFTHEFEGTVTLLAPWAGAAPVSRWSRCYVHTAEGLRGFEAATGAEVWDKPSSVKGPVELLVATHEAGVFATRHEVFALDAATGARRWTYGGPPQHLDDTDGDWEDQDPFRAHSISGNRLVSVQDSGLLRCIAIDSGALIWSATPRPEPSGPMHLSDAWVTYHVIQDDHPTLCLVDAATGAWAGAIPTNESRTVVDHFATLDGQIVIATAQAISCYDSETHKRRWQVPLDGDLRRGSLLTDLDAVYYCDDGRRITKISVESGRRVWVSARLVPAGDDDVTLVKQDTSLIVSSISSISAVDAVTGLTLWEGTAPPRPHFVSRLLTRAYVVALDLADDVAEAESVVYFYDHRNASGMIARDGGALTLGRLADVRAIVAADRSLWIQTGSTIRGWTHP